MLHALEIPMPKTKTHEIPSYFMIAQVHLTSFLNFRMLFLQLATVGILYPHPPSSSPFGFFLE